MNKNNLPYLLIGILIVWCLALSIVSFSSADKNSQTEIVNEYVVDGFSTDFTQIVEDNKTSIVTITCSGNVSSGFIYKQIDDKVYIITSYHGVENGIPMVTFGNSFTTSANVVGKNIYADMAVICVETAYSINSLALGDASALKDGEFIITIGTPISSDYAGSVELGMVSNDDRVVLNSITVGTNTTDYYLDVIQLSSNLKPGYSGSPVLNMKGEVVGMITMSLVDNVNFAITANEIKILADNIIAGNEYVKNHTGIKGSYIATMPTYLKSSLNLPLELLSGLYVDKILPGSLASLAEIQMGDVILSINGNEISNLDNYLNALYTKTNAIEFKVLRNGSTLTLTVHIND